MIFFSNSSSMGNYSNFKINFRSWELGEILSANFAAANLTLEYLELKRGMISSSLNSVSVL